MDCPKCGSVILKDNINIQTDVAQCINCDHIFKISEHIQVDNDDFDVRNTPKGTWFQKDFDTIILGASTQSPIAFFLIPFMLVWSGASLSGIYGSQIASGEFNIGMSLFGIPFLIGTIIFTGITAMAVAGKVELNLNKQGGKIFTGVGNIGFTKTFTWDEVSTIRETSSNIRTNGRQNLKLCLEGKRRVCFGIGLKEERRYYLLKAMQIVLAKLKNNRNMNYQSF